MKNILLLLSLVVLTLTSCLKDSMVEPELIICITEPTFIGQWEQRSFSEIHLDNEGKETQTTAVEFEEGDEKAMKIEFLDPDIGNIEENDAYIAKGKYMATVYDEEAQEITTIEDVYSVLKYSGSAPGPLIELQVNDASTSYFSKIEQDEKGLILTLSNTVIEGEGTDKSVTETVLTFKRKP